MVRTPHGRQAELAVRSEPRLWLIALSLLLAVGFGWLLWAGALPVVPPRRAFAAVAWWTLPGYLLVWLAVLWLRSYRWKWLLDAVSPVPIAKVLAVSFVSCGALIVMPLRTGEAVRPALIRGHGSLSAWEATGTVAAERIIDGLMMTLLVLAALFAATPVPPLPDHVGGLSVPVALVPAALRGSLALFAAAFAVMAAYYYARGPARRATLAVVGLVSRPGAEWMAAKVERVANGLGFLPRAELLAPFLAMSLGYWLLNAAGMWLVCAGCGIALGFAQSAVLMGVLGLSSLLPNAPGLFGAFQLSLYAGLAMYLPADVVTGPGSTAVFLIYLVQITATLLLAAVSLAWLRRLDA